MGSVRWTEAELASRLQAGSVRVAHAFGGTGRGQEVVAERSGVVVTQLCVDARCYAFVVRVWQRHHLGVEP